MIQALSERNATGIEGSLVSGKTLPIVIKIVLNAPEKTPAELLNWTKHGQVKIMMK